MKKKVVLAVWSTGDIDLVAVGVAGQVMDAEIAEYQERVVMAHDPDSWYQAAALDLPRYMYTASQAWANARFDCEIKTVFEQ